MCEEKVCSRCGESKPLDCFSPSRHRGRVGRHSICRRCRSVANSASKSSQRGKTSRYVWPRHADEKAADAALMAWRGPVFRGELRGLM